MKIENIGVEPELKTFKDRLIYELSYRDIPYKVFAGMIGISLNTFNMYIYKNSMPAADIAVKMATALNVSTEYLITGEPKYAHPAIKKQNPTKATSPKKEILKILNSLSQNELASFLKIAEGFKEAVSGR